MSIDFEPQEYDVGIIESETPKKGSLFKGIGIGLVITILLELGLGLALDTHTNLVHRYLAYMLGLIPIIVAAFITRSTLKMFFVGAPVLVASSFVFPYFLPDIFTGLMTPFLNVVPVLNALIDSLTASGLSDPSITQVQQFVNQFGILLDLFFAIIIGVFAAMAFSGIAKMVTKKPGILTIFTFFFSMALILIFVVILPYALIALSGATQFTFTFAAGGIFLQQGVQASQNDTAQANIYFAEAEKWFAEAESMMDGLKALGVFGILGSANPDIQIIVDNGLKLVNAAVDLAQGIVPAISGFTAIQDGMSQAMGDLNTTQTNLQLTLDQTSDFNAGLDRIEEGVADFSKAIINIQDAIQNIREMNKDDLVSAFQGLGAGDVSSQLDILFAAVDLFDATLKVFSNTNGTGLMNDPDGINNDAQRSPIIHLLLGIQAMKNAQNKIGDTSSFENTGSNFRTMINELADVTYSLDPANNPAITDLNNLDLNTSSEISNLRDQITGTINFIKDSSNIAIGIGNFGLIASPTLNAMNKTLTTITKSGLSFSQMDDTLFQNAINKFGDDVTPNTIIYNTTQMISVANNTVDGVKWQIAAMSGNADNNTYGFLSDSAKQFATEFKGFNLTQNSANLYYVASGFSSVTKALQQISIVSKHVDYISSNVTLIETVVTDTLNGGSYNSTSNTTLFTSFDNVKTDLSVSNSTLDIARGYLIDASTNFNSTVGMNQLLATSTALANIEGHISEIQVGDGSSNNGLNGINTEINNMETNILLAGDLTNAYNWLNSNGTTAISTLGDEVTFIQGKFTDIQGELANISIAGDTP